MGGDGVPIDRARAVELWQKAAAQGVVKAQHVLGNWHYSGQGMPADKTKALSCWRMAAEGDLVDAQFQVAQVLFDGEDGIKQDRQMALNMLHKASERNDAESSRWLSDIYARG